jgi:cellobiose transport system substrate-binding protein
MARRVARLAPVGLVVLLLIALTGYGFAQALTPMGAGGHKITLMLWYWNRSIDDSILAQVSRRFPNITLQAVKIGGDYNAKLRTSLAGQSQVPDIVGLNADIATYFPDEDQFVNLLDYGAGAVRHKYLDWKWKEGIAPDGRMIGFPMDTGPTALFYRVDLFKKAGLPTDPRQVATKLATWDDYFNAGKKLQAALPGVYMLPNINMVFTQVMAQSPTQYKNREGQFIGNQGAAKKAWDLAVKAHQMGLSAKAQNYSNDWNAAVDRGKIASFVGAVWMKQILQDAAPDTAGKWHVAPAPGGAGNNGGSFLGVTRYSQHPKEAFEVIKWLQSPPNQLRAYVDIALFPSTPSVYSNPQMDHPEPFYGGQKTTEVFGESAKHVKPAYFSPDDDIINTVYQQQITNIDTQNANPHRAWQATLHEVQRALSH